MPNLTATRTRLSIDSQVLAKILSPMAGVALAGTTEPILSGVRIEALASDLVCLSATDCQLAMIAELPGELIGGPLAIPAQGLLEILRADRSPHCLIASPGEPGEVLVECGYASGSLQSLDPGEFPALPFTSTWTRAASVDGGVLLRALTRVIPAAGPPADYIRAIFGSRTTLMVATNDFVLSAVEEIPAKVAKITVLSLPTRAAVAIQDCLDSLDFAGQVEISCNPSQTMVEFRVGSVRILSMLKLDAGFPDWSGVVRPAIPRSDSFLLRLPAQHLRKSLNSLGAGPLSLLISNGEATISRPNCELEILLDLAQIGVDRDAEVAVLFDRKLLMPFLALCAPSDQLTLRLGSPLPPSGGCPMIWSIDGEPDYTFVQMPMQPGKDLEID